MNLSGKKSSLLGILLSVLLLSLSVSTAHGQWAYTYGGSSNDRFTSIQQTQDGGYVLVGHTYSLGVGNSDVLVMKLSSEGDLTWQKAYGGTGYDQAKSIQQTQDGGYIVAGNTSSFGSGDNNMWVMKLDSSGAVTWQKTYGGTGQDYAQSIQQTRDGGYIVAGHTSSFSAGDLDLWVLKLDSNGGVTWQKTYGGSDDDYTYSIRQTQDEGYIVSGQTFSFGEGITDAWVLKLDSTGGVTWQKTYGASGEEGADSIQQTRDGGYILSGSTTSFGAENFDAWIMKLNSSGAIVWQKIYGGPGDDWANTVQQTWDGGYIVSGATWSFGSGADSAWVIKLDRSGKIAWQKIYGGSSWDSAASIQQTQDRGYIVAGQTCSSVLCDADTLLVLKLDRAGTIGPCALEGRSTAAVSNTTASVVDTSVIPGTTTVTGVDTAAVVTDGLASAKQWCTLSGDLQKLKVGFTRKQRGEGTITSGDGLINCPGSCEAEYDEMATITLFPNPDPLSTFLGWKPSSLGCLGTDPCQVTMDKNKSVKAVFQGPNRLKVVMTSKHSASGTVTSSDTLVNCPGDCDESYKLNTEVTLTANPESNSRFVKWTGNPCKNEVTNQCTFTMDKNYTVKAIFDRVCEGTEEGLEASYSNGRHAFEGPINHGWGTSCLADPPYEHNLYQGVCTPLADSPVDWAKGGWGEGSDPTAFSVSWDGYLFAPVDGVYTFSGWVDGTVYIEINGGVVADLNTIGSGYAGTVTLPGGRCVPIRMSFTTNGGSNNMVLNWRPPGASASEIVSRTHLRHQVGP
jgi:hypothetical protein